MKILPKANLLILLFAIVNICVFTVVVLLFFMSDRVRIAPYGETRKNYSIPDLPSKLAEQIVVGGKAYIIYDPESRAVLLGKNERLRFTPASTVKVMTAVIALEHYDLDQVLKAQDVGRFEGSRMNLVEDEQITVRNLLYGMLLPSGNDAARILAQNFPGGESAFVLAMNKKASDLLMNNSRFVDPDGYDDLNYTTAYDMARLGAYAMENPTFKKIVGTKRIILTDVTGKIVHNLGNLNELLGADYVNGIKTGFTDEAGGVLLTSIEKDNREYIVVVLNSSDRFSDTRNLVQETLQKIRLLFY